MGHARGAGATTHVGGRPENTKQQELVMFLALDWFRATDTAPRAGSSGFGELVHCVFRGLRLRRGSAVYALRQYWAERRTSNQGRR